MTSYVWAVVAALWALAIWDMVRRWAFAVATRALKVELSALRLELEEAQLPARVAKLEKLVIALKSHIEIQRAARMSPFARKSG
jgi:hypothetical protein